MPGPPSAATISLDEVVGVATLLALGVALVAGKLAKDQLTAAEESLAAANGVARGQFILAIDEALARYESLRTDITYRRQTFAPYGPASAPLRYYIAVFERIGLLTS